ncbi:hypothetical protein IJ425_04080 [bacterium]|nr:hypothetical protein [bacterium]
MNKAKFETLARTTGANKCIDFDWSYNLKGSCMKDYLSKRILQPCCLLKGQKCDCMNKANEA